MIRKKRGRHNKVTTLDEEGVEYVNVKTIISEPTVQQKQAICTASGGFFDKLTNFVIAVEASKALCSIFNGLISFFDSNGSDLGDDDTQDDIDGDYDNFQDDGEYYD